MLRVIQSNLAEIQRIVAAWQRVVIWERLKARTYTPEEYHKSHEVRAPICDHRLLRGSSVSEQTAHCHGFPLLPVELLCGATGRVSPGFGPHSPAAHREQPNSAHLARRLRLEGLRGVCGSAGERGGGGVRGQVAAGSAGRYRCGDGGAQRDATVAHHQFGVCPRWCGLPPGAGRNGYVHARAVRQAGRCGPRDGSLMPSAMDGRTA